MTSVTLLSRGTADEGRMRHLPHSSSGSDLEEEKRGEKMYKVVTKEDTIRIPAEYIRKDKSLNEHIDRLAASAFEGRFDDQNRFVLVTSNH